MTENTLILILPNIFICSECDNKILQDNSINNIININNSLINFNMYNTLNINVNDFNDLVHSNNYAELDLNAINDFIINILNNKENVVICDNSYVFGFIILCAFILKFMNMTFTETMMYVQRKMDIDIKTIPQILFFQLFDFYTH